MSKLALALILGVCVAGIALIAWGWAEKCPEAEKIGEELEVKAIIGLVELGI